MCYLLSTPERRAPPSPAGGGAAEPPGVGGEEEEEGGWKMICAVILTVVELWTFKGSALSFSARPYSLHFNNLTLAQVWFSSFAEL